VEESGIRTRPIRRRIIGGLGRRFRKKIKPRAETCSARGSSERWRVVFDVLRWLSEEVVLVSKDDEQTNTCQRDVCDLVRVVLSETAGDQMADDEECAHDCGVHDFPPQGTGFSLAPLPKKLPVSCDSGNTISLAYFALEVKLSKKPLKSKLFLG